MIGLGGLCGRSVKLVLAAAFVLGCGGGDSAPTTAPVMRTGQTVSYAEGDDGDLMPGKPFPTPRFTDNEDGTVTDNATGLIWLGNANFTGSMRNWEEAMDACAALADGEAGLTDGSVPGDWRLPNVRELHSLVDFGQHSPCLPDGHPFTDVVSTEFYWSSTTLSDSITFANRIYLGNGQIGWNGKTIAYRVWPVKGSSAHIARTGQTVSHEADDDGDLQLGVKWPNGRFVDNGNGTVTDRLTGLMWMKSADAADGAVSWADALAFCNDLVFAGRSDWRLPTVRELESLTDYARFSPALPSGHPFENVKSDTDQLYWSSTTCAADADDAWYLWWYDGILTTRAKTNAHFVWPVRGGN